MIVRRNDCKLRNFPRFVQEEFSKKSKGKMKRYIRRPKDAIKVILIASRVAFPDFQPLFAKHALLLSSSPRPLLLSSDAITSFSLARSQTNHRLPAVSRVFVRRIVEINLGSCWTRITAAPTTSSGRNYASLCPANSLTTSATLLDANKTKSWRWNCVVKLCRSLLLV